jgi:hypothetical protein
VGLEGVVVTPAHNSKGHAELAVIEHGGAHTGDQGPARLARGTPSAR